MRKMYAIIACLYIPTYIHANSYCIYNVQSDLKDITQQTKAQQPLIAVIGTGYVGLVTGTGLAECDNNVVCVDIDTNKINSLKKGFVPIYEPGLAELIAKNVKQERLSFTDDVEQALYDASIIFIAVGTPDDGQGCADLRALISVVKAIARVIDSHKTIVTKSTVPVGTGAFIRHMLEHDLQVDGTLFDIVSNPEFLREGSAVHDFLEPDRIVIGAESSYAFNTVCNIYQTILSKGVPYVLTNIPTAEIIKYASNAFLAIKLSFINEIANLCDATGGQVKTVSRAMGLDHRISPKFLNPGPGYGGSCFPKDTQALLHMAQKHSVTMNTVHGAITTNEAQQHIPVQKLRVLMNNNLNNKTVTLLGLAFKANTDDIRYSPAITVIEELLALGVQVRAYDPQAINNMKQLFPDIIYCQSLEEALTDTDALIIMTEWDEFKKLDLALTAHLMRGNYIVDARNLLDLNSLKSYGFVYDGIGQGSR